MTPAEKAREERLRHAGERRAQMLEVTDQRPFWELRANGFVECSCMPHHGLILRWDDPFWDEHPVPCEHLECSARIFSLSARDLSKRGIEPPGE